MKRALIGGFLPYRGASGACLFSCISRTAWSPSGRVITPLGAAHMGVPFFLAAALAAAGLAILIREYFRKEN